MTFLGAALALATYAPYMRAAQGSACWPGASAADQPNIFSCTKSIVSLLVGIALEQGLLPGLDARVVNLLPQRAAAMVNPDPRKGRLTLRHLLTMSR